MRALPQGTPLADFSTPNSLPPSLEGASPGAGTQSPVALKSDQLLFCQDVWEKPPRLLPPDMDQSPVSWRLVAPPHTQTTSLPRPRLPLPPSPCLRAALGGPPALGLCSPPSPCSRPRSPLPPRTAPLHPAGPCWSPAGPGEGRLPWGRPCGPCRADSHRPEGWLRPSWALSFPAPLTSCPQQSPRAPLAPEVPLQAASWPSRSCRRGSSLFLLLVPPGAPASPDTGLVAGVPGEAVRVHQGVSTAAQTATCFLPAGEGRGPGRQHSQVGTLTAPASH